MLFIQPLCYASGHHRGEQDIELSASIMRFLTKIKEEPWTECDDSFPDEPLEKAVPLQRLSVSIDKYIEPPKSPKAPPNTPEDQPKIVCSADQ